MEQGRLASLGDGTPAGSEELVPTLVPTLPEVRITGGGEERVDPAVLNFIMQAAQASHLAKLRKLEESKVTEGSISIETVISGRTRWAFDEPLIAFSLTNDGDDDDSTAAIYAEINRGGPISNGATIKKNEVWEWTAGYPIVNYLTLVPTSGSPTARLRARTGRRIEGITPPLILDAEAIQHTHAG